MTLNSVTCFQDDGGNRCSLLASLLAVTVEAQLDTEEGQGGSGFLAAVSEEWDLLRAHQVPRNCWRVCKCGRSEGGEDPNSRLGFLRGEAGCLAWGEARVSLESIIPLPLANGKVN